MKFRKKPVVIEATQWFKHGDHPMVKFDPAPYVRRDHHGWIETLEGGHVVTPGDWIITGVKGEHYPCKPDIFEATYQSAELPTPTTTLQDFTREAFAFATKMEPIYEKMDWHWASTSGRPPRAADIAQELLRQYELLIRDNFSYISSGGLAVERDEYGTISIKFEHEVIVMPEEDDNE